VYITCARDLCLIENTDYLTDAELRVEPPYAELRAEPRAKPLYVELRVELIEWIFINSGSLALKECLTFLGIL